MSHSLFNYVGIRGCTTRVAASGRFINELPGINMNGIQKIADSEQVTYLQVWDDIQLRAWDRLVIDLRNRLKSKFQIKTNRGFFQLETQDQGDTEDAVAEYKGLFVDGGIDLNGFFAIHVSSISIDLTEAVDSLTLKLLDRSGNLLDSFTITNAVEGINTVAVNEQYSASAIFIATDATDLVMKQTNITQGSIAAFANMMTAFLGCGCAPYIYGAISAIATPSYISRTTSTHGISAVLMPVCDYSSIVGWNKSLFLTAWMNLCGLELMLERMFSDRINILTTVKAKDAEGLRDLYTGQYENALADTIGGLTISAEDACIACRQEYKRREVLP